MFSPALVCLSVCLSVCVCVSVCDHDNYKIVDGFVPNFPKGKGKTNFVFRYDR